MRMTKGERLGEKKVKRKGKKLLYDLNPNSKI